MPCEDYENDLQDIHASLQGEGAAYARLVRRYESAIATTGCIHPKSNEQRELPHNIIDTAACLATAGGSIYPLATQNCVG